LQSEDSGRHRRFQQTEQHKGNIDMNRQDPKLTVLLFNECINGRDVDGLADLMSEDHVFMDRENNRVTGRDVMKTGWTGFFDQFPEYRNTFTRLDSKDDLVVILGYTEWETGGELDHVIWTAKVEDDLIAEWRIYEDTPENRNKFLS